MIFGEAPCHVCRTSTLERVEVGDGRAAICSDACAAALAHELRLLAEIGAWLAAIPSEYQDGDPVHGRGGVLEQFRRGHWRAREDAEHLAVVEATKNESTVPWEDVQASLKASKPAIDRARAFIRAVDAGDIAHDDRVTALVDLLGGPATACDAWPPKIGDRYLVPMFVVNFGDERPASVRSEGGGRWLRLDAVHNPYCHGTFQPSQVRLDAPAAPSPPGGLPPMAAAAVASIEELGLRVDVKELALRFGVADEARPEPGDLVRESHVAAPSSGPVEDLLAKAIESWNVESERSRQLTTEVAALRKVADAARAFYQLHCDARERKDWPIYNPVWLALSEALDALPKGGPA